LFYCLGDFYETFDADAEIAARELDLVLTSRPVGRDQRVPMAGVPHHALEPYVTKLIEKGYSVAIAEQMGEPNGTGIVERRIERVLTPSDNPKTAKTGVLNPEPIQTPETPPPPHLASISQELSPSSATFQPNSNPTAELSPMGENPLADKVAELAEVLKKTRESPSRMTSFSVS
jgi:hypothetical protein